MTPETCVVLVRTYKKCATMDRSYWCFYLYFPDGSSEYCGGSYTSARLVAGARFPGYPVIQGLHVAPGTRE